MIERPEGITDAQWHCDAVADTGDGYTEFHGYVLDCLWCDYRCQARLQRDARRMVKAHFDERHEQFLREDAALAEPTSSEPQSESKFDAPGPDPDGGLDLTDEEFAAFLKAAKS